MTTDIREGHRPACVAVIDLMKGGVYDSREELEWAIGSAAYGNWKNLDLSTYFNPEGFADLALRRGWVVEIDGEFRVVDVP